MTDVSYVPGDRTAIVGDRCWVLIDAAPDSAIVAGTWQWMERAAGLDALVVSLLQVGFEQVPDFAVLAAAEGGHHLICRGRAGATLVARGSPERVDGTGLATWLECRVGTDVERIVLGEPPVGSELRLPAFAGVFLAHSVSVDLAAPPRDRGLGPATGTGADDDRGNGQVTRVGQVTGAGRDVGNGRAAANGWGAGTADTILTRAHPGSPRHAAVSQGDAGREGVNAGREKTDGPAEDRSYDFLFGVTQARTVEGAAVRPEEADAGMPFSLPFAAPTADEPPPARPSVVAGPGPADLDTPGGLIDAVPWATGADYGRPAEVHTPYLAAQSPAADADDGATVMRSDLAKLAARSTAPDSIGPTVQAMLCPDGHPNPPGSPACRLCGAPVPRQAPVTVPRPALGVLRLSTGDLITLDRGVVLGRSPRTEFTGVERPHVVKLSNGDSDVSRTHLQVSLDGWQVLVTDLNSTNGTLVAPPGRDPERLPPGEPTPIQPGTQVILAIGVHFYYEAAS